MCGIIGYIGGKPAVPFLVEGLKKLEYRGYDSAGLATIFQKKCFILRQKGKIADLEKRLQKKWLKGNIGLGHTRWATHGQPSEENAHPHTDCHQEIVVVHNGIVENYLKLKNQLEKAGHFFRSETDTEIIAHLIEKHLTSAGVTFEEAVRKALQEIVGSYGLAVIYVKAPTTIIAARNESPLILGKNEEAAFVASDIPALLKYTRRVIFLENGELATVSPHQIEVKEIKTGRKKHKTVHQINWSSRLAEKEGYPHFMLKEIYEQPRAIEETIRGRIDPLRGQIHLEEMKIPPAQLKKIKRIIITACGTSWHAGLVGEYMIEEMVRVPVEVEYAAEFRYRNPILNKETLVIAISQSGETADTLAAVKEVKKSRKGTKVVAICNVVGSSLTREADSVIYTHAGPEIGVASTKAFTTQLVVLYLLGLFLSRVKGTLKLETRKRMLAALRVIPHQVREVLEKQEKMVKKIAERFYQRNNFLYLGRGKGFPVALEGALKLKEVSYIHAEGYPAAEMKHGPIALIDENMPVVVLALTGKRYEKILGNIEEVKTRKGIVVALTEEKNTSLSKRVDEIIYIPETLVPLTPILAVVPLQLLAYYIAAKRGCEIDQPRNLAKSVTVE